MTCRHPLPSRVIHFGDYLLAIYSEPGTGAILETGNVFTIEPMINVGRHNTRLLADGWTAITTDRSLSAQFEHTIGVTENGYEIFTLSEKNMNKPPYETTK